jgi:hypothetical protein
MRQAQVAYSETDPDSPAARHAKERRPIMEAPRHSMNDLFSQLGLQAGPEEIERFIATHGPLPATVRLADAPFWTPAQAAFLRESLLVDADWSDVIDLLNEELHAGS